MSRYQLVYLKEVEKNIKRLTKAIIPVIHSKILKLQSDPYFYGKPLRYSLKNIRSCRVGDYRILYQINEEKQQIVIATIRHRKDCYQQFN